MDSTNNDRAILNAVENLINFSGDNLLNEALKIERALTNANSQEVRHLVGILATELSEAIRYGNPDLNETELVIEAMHGAVGLYKRS